MPKRSSPKSIPSIDAQHAWLTLNEAQAALRVGRKALNNMMRRGEVPFRQFGRRRRIPREALQP